MIRNGFATRLALLASFILITVSSQAQKVSTSLSREFNIAILNLLDQYESTSSFTEEQDRRAFIRLFEQPDKAIVYNDLIGSKGYQTKISAVDYVGLIPNGTAFLKTEIRDVAKEGEIYKVGNLYHRKISFTKYLMIIDSSIYSEGEGGVFFDSSTMYSDSPDFCLVADIVFDPNSGRCKIADLSATEQKKVTPLDAGRYSIVLKSSDKYDGKLTSNGEPVKFNEYNQALAYYDDLDISDQNVKIEVNKKAAGSVYDIIDVRYRPLKKRVKFHASYLPLSSYSVKSSYPISNSSNGFEFGADFGVERSMSDHSRIGFYVGAGLSSSSIDMTVNDISYSYALSNKVSRDYKFSASEGVSCLDFVFPVYIDMEFDLGKNMMLTADIGAKAFYNSKTNLKPYKVEGNFSGQSINRTFDKFISPAVYSRTPVDVCIFANLELDYCLVKKLCYLYVSAGYEQGARPSYDFGSKAYYDPSSKVYPFVYSASAGEDVAFRSIVGSTVYTRSALQTSLGVKFKF